MTNTNWKTQAWLEDQYYCQLKSFKQIAYEIGVSDVYVGLVARQLGVSARPIADERSKKTSHITKSKLIKLYALGYTIAEIASQHHIPISVMIAKFHRFGINTRQRCESRRLKLDRSKLISRQVWSRKSWLCEHYVQQTMSTKDISRLTGWSRNAIRARMLEVGISLRSTSEAIQLKADVISVRNKALWQTASFQNKMAKVFAERPKVSSLQEILYSILDDLGVKYYREYNDKVDDPECRIGAWSYDCVVPRINKPTLLIECQGSYYHNQRITQNRDVKKYADTLVTFPGQYEIKQLWEHEFYCESRVSDQLKYWFGLNETIDFSFNDVKIVLLERSQAKKFFSQYHYLGGIGHRGTIIHGAILDDKLVAAIIFSPLVRQNIPTGGCSYSVVREISRLCIHPLYHKKNFASWFVAKALKALPNRFKLVIAYADATHNHIGIVYKACNFKQDKIVSPDYWYCDDFGRKIHKKTLYNQAKSAKMIESEFAIRFGYSKVFGSYKYRFVLMR